MVTSPSVSLRSVRRMPSAFVSPFGSCQKPLVASPPLLREKVCTKSLGSTLSK
ncbi:MAG: hypothetical protein ACLR17_04325 [Enterobacteriaceae bacterium]